MNKRPQQTEETKANIREAFWNLYVARGMAKITVSDIAAAAGYNRGTFYLHFRDVEDVLNSGEEILLGEMSECVEACMKELGAGSAPEKAMQVVLDYYASRKTYLTHLLGRNGDPAFTEKVKELLKPLWRSYILPQRTEQRPDDDFLLEYTLSGALFMVSKWIENPHGVTPERLLHILYHSAIEK